LYEHRLQDINYKYSGSALSLDIIPEKFNVDKSTEVDT